MSEDFLKDPLSLFSVKGKTAVVTGATGAFGAIAAKIAGRRRRQCGDLRQQRRRPEEARGRMRGARRQGPHRRQAAELGGELRDHRQRGGRPLQQRRHPRGRVRPEQGGQDRRSEGRRFPRRHGRQRHAVVADGARRRPADAQAGQGRQGHPDVVGARPARPSRRLFGLLRLEVGDRRHHQGARLRVGRRRHHRQRARPDGLPLAADRMDVRRRRARQDHARGLSHPRAARPPRRARPISPGRCCSSPRRRRISTPAISSTPTAATPRAESWPRKRASPSSARA